MAEVQGLSAAFQKTSTVVVFIFKRSSFLQGENDGGGDRMQHIRLSEPTRIQWSEWPWHRVGKLQVFLAHEEGALSEKQGEGGGWHPPGSSHCFSQMLIH